MNLVAKFLVSNQPDSAIFSTVTQPTPLPLPKLRLSEPVLFVWILLGFNALAIGLYYSGVYGLQQIVAPTMEVLRPAQWREFGLLEFVQHGLLLAIIWVLVKSALANRSVVERVLLAGATAAFVFLFLEEIDYGLHFYELATGKYAAVSARNWHNQWGGELENATVLKRLNDAVIILWFILLPLLTRVPRLGAWLRRFPLVPSLWFTLGFFLSLVCSKFAHYLDDQGLAVINGVDGNLSGTIAEFRETSTYYLYFLYALTISKLNPMLYRPREVSSG